MDDIKTRLTDPARLKSLAATDLMDSSPEQSFDRLTSLVSKVLGVPVSLVSLIDDERQFFKSSVGIDERETPLSHSFCQYVVADAKPLIVQDAREDPRLQNNKAVEEFNVIAYLGFPILASNEHVLGSLCAIDSKPKTWSQDDIELVEELAAIVASEIAARQQLRERRSVDAALSSSESRLELALAAGHMGAWDWDLKTDEVIFSDAAYKIWDKPQSENVTGEWIFSRIHTEDLARVEAAIEAAIKEGKDFDAHFRICWQQGEERWLVGRGSVIWDADGKASRMLGVNYDISEEKRVKEQLQRLNLELEERISERTGRLEVLNKELEAFNYSVSHDLRAPLRGIDGFSSALQNEYGSVLDETATHYLSRVRAGAQRMGELIDDLLDLSRLSRSELRLVEVDITRLAQVIIQHLIDTDDRTWQIEIAPNLTAKADKRLLTVALENLLGNAVKFTSVQDAPYISFGCSEEGVFFLSDNGVGFDVKFANKLFIPFQRLHTTSEFEGSGIGLATVQRIINRHGGRLWAESELGEGATFYFTLPTPKTKQ